jgi:carboxyl-terminal processing protease
MQESREKNKGKEGAINKTDAEFEKDAREKVLAAINRTFDYYRNKMTEEEKIQSFCKHHYQLN